jgi:hypothetical protein
MEVPDRPARHMTSWEVMEGFAEHYNRVNAARAADGHQPKDIQKNALYNHLMCAPAGKQSRECIQAFLLEMKDFDLEIEEKVQLVDFRPSTVLHLEVLIRNCEQRFSPEEQQAILAACLKHLPPPVSESEAAEIKAKSVAFWDKPWNQRGKDRIKKDRAADAQSAPPDLVIEANVDDAVGEDMDEG